MDNPEYINKNNTKEVFMCVVCVEFAKGKLNFSEARKALAEIALNSKDLEHVQEVFETIYRAEQGQDQPELKRIQPIG